MSKISIRPGTPEDIEPAIAVWRAANTARRGGKPAPETDEQRLRGYMTKPDAFLLVSACTTGLVGVGLGMQGLADDGKGPPIPGLCHIGMIFVVPIHWGQGIGGQLVDAVLAEAQSRGYDRVQLWTHLDNARAQRLYDGRGFSRSGRQTDDDGGERIVHYTRTL